MAAAGGKARASWTPRSTHSPPGRAAFRILCRVSDMPSVAGAEDCALAELRRPTHTDIQVDVAAAEDCDERVIVVAGATKPKKEVILVSGNSTPLSPAQDGLLAVFERAMLAESDKSGWSEPPDAVVWRMLVDESQVGALMGRGGSIIDAMRKESGAHIRVLPGNKLPACANSSEKLLQITGDKGSVRQAIVAVSSRLQDFPPVVTTEKASKTHNKTFHKTSSRAHGSASSAPERSIEDGVNGHLFMYGNNKITKVDPTKDVHEISFRLLCSNYEAGAIIGTKGVIVKALENETGALISFGAIVAQSADRMITITALELPESQFSRAQSAVLRVFDRSVEVRMKSELPHSLEEQVSARLLVPKIQIGSFLGKNSVIIQELIKTSGAGIEILGGEHVPNCALDTDQVIQITGKPQNVKDALFRVTSRLRDDISSAKRTSSFGASVSSSVALGSVRSTSPMQYPSVDFFHSGSYQSTLANAMDHLGISSASKSSSSSTSWSPKKPNEENPRAIKDADGGITPLGPTQLERGSKTATVTNTTLEIAVPESIFGLVHGENGNNVSLIRQDALQHLASVDLIELCNEAKIENCRATRDLSSCGRPVQYMLNSCGHASLCAECSQRCDACPICRTSIPNSGSRVQLRLYYKCIEAGLISKLQDDRLQSMEDSRSHVGIDIDRLYSLFNVALHNNLVSLICHYVTDVCMDENAVSSDPVLAFLFDEVVVKEWCKQTVVNVISDLRQIYRYGFEAMKSNLPLLQKFSRQLSGIYSVLEVMVLSFKQTVSAQVDELHQLFEDTLKAKQHLEVMIWCVRHSFLEEVQSRYSNFASWCWHFHERKSAAAKRSWPDVCVEVSNSALPKGNMLFIEQALQNLGIEWSYMDKQEEVVDISCLQDQASKSDQSNTSVYPFKNLQVAADVLFLHGASDMVVAKRAIFLYYLFDRHWTKPEEEWKYLVEDFAAAFGITRHSLLECLVFYLLDDHSLQALEEAICLLPKIANKETHPKIAQVLLERQRPDVALTVLRCTGRDGSCPAVSIEDSASLSEVVTAVRIRIEYGHLTEAFMYHRAYCSKLKQEKSEHVALYNNTNFCDHVEVLVSEICSLCIERNLVDRMIELPWNPEEEKHLHKCLYDHARQRPTTTCGSLLVVYYLQRYRYSEAFEVDQNIQSLEGNALETVGGDTATRIRKIAQWRHGLVAKCLELLPEAQRREAASASLERDRRLSTQDAQLPLASIPSTKLPSPVTPLTCSISSTVIPKKLDFSHEEKAKAWTNFNFTTSDSYDEYNGKAPSIVQQRLLAHLETPLSSKRSVVTNGISSSVAQNGEDSLSRKNIEVELVKRQADHSLPLYLRSQATPSKNLKAQSMLFKDNEKIIFSHSRTSENAGILKGSIDDQKRRSPLEENPRHSFLSKDSEETIVHSWRFDKRDSPAEHLSARVGSRWRSDESSDDDGDQKPDGNLESGVSLASRRRPRFTRI